MAIPRTLIRLGAASAVLFAGMQLIRPELAHPPVVADLQAPAEIKKLLQTACYNCHSNETRLPWFDRIVPAYWLVVRDVRLARNVLNFSHFGLPPGKQRALLYESLNQVLLGAMPPVRYQLVHPESVLSAEQIAVIEDYLRPATPLKAATSEQVAAATVQFASWSASGGAAPALVKPAPNGLTFFADYKNWKAVSTTERFDDHRLRVITGNDVAIHAIASGQTNPWPDGSAFAKIAWDQLVQPDGSVQSGAFTQVAFMIKDAKKYASTEGWGFSQWLGPGLAPYGKGPDFADECAGCHAPLRREDFVYTLPIARSLPAELPYQPLEWRVVTSGLDQRASTMSTLYGNDLAVDHARTSAGGPYPEGSVLALVVWAERDDPHWFGARIPGPIRSIEFVSVGPESGTGSRYAYQRFADTPLHRVPAAAGTEASRTDWIVRQRASVMP